MLVVKNLPVNAGDLRDEGLISGSGRSPVEGNGNPLQYSCLGNPMDRGTWWNHRVARSWTRLKWLHTHTHTHTHTQINYSRSWCLKTNKMPSREARQKNRKFINEFMLSERIAVPVFQEYTSVRGMSNKFSLTCRRKFRGITERRTLNLLKLLEFIHQKKSGICN